ncbi:hypothetical protein [uncultured Parabacteroides sp.]|uniref:hypothetical protein n=1 Tax=uncultured Parabacteroides sp. TaxID=512312 RepID=UPI002622BEE4|nr:hypothetical protein [uncultured Parabacteroides sp.]
MSKIEQMTAELNKVLHSNTYQFEIDTEDFVFGFKKTIKKRTKSLAKAIKLKAKLTKDCGRFLSGTVRFMAVRFYKNGKLTKEIKAKEITATYNE